jgi:hypothetical protein
LKKLGVFLTTAALALTPAAATAKAKHVACGKHKPRHSNCGKHKAVAKGKTTGSTMNPTGYGY